MTLAHLSHAAACPWERCPWQRHVRDSVHDKNWHPAGENEVRQSGMSVRASMITLSTPVERTKRGMSVRATNYAVLNQPNKLGNRWKWEQNSRFYSKPWKCIKVQFWLLREHQCPVRLKYPPAPRWKMSLNLGVKWQGRKQKELRFRWNFFNEEKNIFEIH